MVGRHGTFIAQPGERDTLVGYLLQAAEALQQFEACYLYIVSTSPTDENAIHVMEIWRTSDDHRASLELESTQAFIARARPLIADIQPGVEFTPLGGKGLPSV